MYKVFLNGELLYDSLCISERAMTIQSPTIEINKEGGSFSFTVPKEHALWSSFENETVLRRTSQIVMFEDDEWLWEGCIIDYGKDYFGNFKINCSGALKYLKNTNLPLEKIVDITRWSTETSSDFFVRAFSTFAKAITTQHNNRINDLESVGYPGTESSLRHQKIYFDSRAYDSLPAIQIDEGVVPPDHFVRVVNFETCYDALQKRIVDDFGGFFYLIKKEVQISNELKLQDTVLNASQDTVRTLLLLRYRMTPLSTDNYVAYLGHNLLDYNISEDFDLATAAIPLGDTYDENHPGESRWWLKDERSAFYNITQRANYSWRSYTTTHPIHPDGQSGTRVFLPSTVSGASEIVAKYGMRDVVVEFDTVVAKYPDVPVWESNGRHYIRDQYIKYTNPATGVVRQYKVMVDVVSSPSMTPTSSSSSNPYSLIPSGSEKAPWAYYMYIKGHNGETPYWLSKDDYLGNTYIDNGRLFDVKETALGDHAYIQEYMLALRILAEDYLTDQQFNKLVLDISATKVSSTNGERFNALRSFGTKIPVSASLFGENLKPYEVTGVTIQLDDDSQSRLTLGGEDTKITKLITTK